MNDKATDLYSGLQGSALVPRMGRLEVICGPMFSGKSEELIRRMTRARIAGKKTVVFKPVIDTRTWEYIVKSHSGAEIEAISFSDSYAISSMFEDHQYDVIGIDEVQFTDDLFVTHLQNMLIGDQAPIVIVAGLDMTYRQEPFGIVPNLMAIADSVTKLDAVCHSCGNNAIYTQRLINGEPASFAGETIQVGGLDSYEARCRNCFERA